MAPSHYLNQCWFTISKVHRHSSEDNFTTCISAINHFNWIEKYSSKISLKSPRPQWFKDRHLQISSAGTNLQMNYTDFTISKSRIVAPAMAHGRLVQLSPILLEFLYHHILSYIFSTMQIFYLLMNSKVSPIRITTHDSETSLFHWDEKSFANAFSKIKWIATLIFLILKPE